MPSDDVFRKITPACDSGLALIAGDGEAPLIALLGIHVNLDVKHDDGPKITHALFSDSQKLSAILGEFDPFHGGIEFPHFDTLARPNIPETYSVIRGSAGE